ncbi:hypothetical protein PTTG_12702 [Puccinia triticina 1-1 BBBD Race 1]|uniref:Uncharacterized protein n=2 Tax=Puccinia triticina TaxID=208348 RepID=A0A180GV41_PUCT1|nr:uncharacterized protein PtA15_1A762 [Puccinia triticina]OAV96645.1 hypothetical protein PTTG_12702 [Puccinia triticina 1-1 BBBD Race 1]WAQ81421.1 hypothetical protein PtA15_1A762 [Puccinia triticina]WAR52303.1 hypothetical protein PtB15_1B744 [Puccinia triticina]
MNGSRQTSSAADMFIPFSGPAASGCTRSNFVNPENSGFRERKTERAAWLLVYIKRRLLFRCSSLHPPPHPSYNHLLLSPSLSNKPSIFFNKFSTCCCAIKFLHFFTISIIVKDWFFQDFFFLRASRYTGDCSLCCLFSLVQDPRSKIVFRTCSDFNSTIQASRMIRVNRLSNRVFVAQFKDPTHGARGCDTRHLIVVPTDQDCTAYGIRASARRHGFYEVYLQFFPSQRQLFRDIGPLRPIIRLGNPSDSQPNGTNAFRVRVLDTKHVVWYRSVHGQWCCRDWVLDVLYAELDHQAFPLERLWKLIDHLEHRRRSSAVASAPSSSPSFDR